MDKNTPTFNNTELNSRSLIDILAYFGFHPKKNNNKEAWYISPFRTERTASFKVNIVRNLWYDFGEGTGGGVVKLLNRLNPLSETAQPFFKKAIVSARKIQHTKTGTPPQKNYQINRTQPLKKRELVGYLVSRNILPTIAKIFCNEVYYKINTKSQFAIGFRNISNGIELRNKYFKGCFGKKNISLISHQSKGVNVFEGFIDFLSYCSYYETLYKEYDFLILNSTSMVSKAIPNLTKYEEINLYLDNDTSGNKATEFLKKHFPKAIDKRKGYNFHKDFNDFISAL